MPRRLPPLNALRAFEAAARSENLTRAAKELGVSQAAVSQQVKALEATLGIKLFARNGKRLVITGAGQTISPSPAMRWIASPSAPTVCFSAPPKRSRKEAEDELRLSPFGPKTSDWSGRDRLRRDEPVGRSAAFDDADSREGQMKADDALAIGR
jgi:hypothetical protein